MAAGGPGDTLPGCAANEFKRLISRRAENLYAPRAQWSARVLYSIVRNAPPYRISLLLPALTEDPAHGGFRAQINPLGNSKELTCRIPGPFRFPDFNSLVGYLLWIALRESPQKCRIPSQRAFSNRRLPGWRWIVSGELPREATGAARRVQ